MREKPLPLCTFFVYTEYIIKFRNPAEVFMKLNYKRTILIGFAFMAISAFWQMYDSIIPLILKNTFSLGETWTGVIMAIDNVLAVFLLPLFGVWSDRTNTLFGKRSPFIYVVLFLLLLSMSFYRSPAVALMPDLTPPPLRSKGNAVINLMGAVGFIYALVMIKILGGDPKTRPSYVPLFAVIGALMIVSLLVLLFTVRETKIQKDVETECRAAGITMDPTPDENPPKDAVGTVNRIPKSIRLSLVMILFSVAFWYIAYNAVTTAFSRYASEVWHIGSGYADCLLIASAVAVVSYLPIGILSGIIGRKLMILCGVIIMAASYGCLFFFTSYHFTAAIFFGLIGFGWAAINVNSLPMVVDMCEQEDIGRFTGYYYTFSMAAQVFTPIASGALLEYVGYRTLFPYAVVFMILAFITMQFVRHGDIKPAGKKSLLEHFDVGD